MRQRDGFGLMEASKRWKQRRAKRQTYFREDSESRDVSGCSHRVSDHLPGNDISAERQASQQVLQAPAHSTCLAFGLMAQAPHHRT